MKRLMLLAGAALMVAPAAFAGPDKSKTPDKIECPVMKGRMVDVKDATAKKMFSDYKGKRYYFCCGMCPKAFAKDPAKYAKGPSLPTPKEKKGKKA